MKKIVLFIIIISSVIIFIMKNEKRDQIVFASYGIPFSSDPLDFDYYVHHYAFSSVFSRLVSIEKSGEVTAELASSWENLEDFKIWRFKLRNNLKYSNGDIIKHEDILKNFKRLLYLSQKHNSKSGLLEFITDCDLATRLDSSCSGLSLNGNTLEFRFKKPMKNLLSLISFGFYGLAHPSLYNHDNGSWIDKKNVISSSNYEVLVWNKDEFVLSLRNDSKIVDIPNSIKKIKIINLENIKESHDLDSVDLLFADKSSLLVDNRFKFIGSSINLKIGYLRVNSWDNPNSELSKLEVRKWLRSKFYKKLNENGLPIISSFLPTNLNGINEINSIMQSEKPSFKKFSLKVPEIKISGKLVEYKDKKSIPEIFKDSLNALDDNNIELIFSNTAEIYDLQILGTGIEASDYMDTVKFMFLSKEGIRLPDINGNILNELKKQNPDANYINEQIWEQAVIWPIRHYSGGYWYKNDSDINVELINVDSPSIDFQFVRWN